MVDKDTWELRHNDRIELILHGESIRMAIRALDLYFRMHLGQYDAIDRLYFELYNPAVTYNRDEEAARDEYLIQIRDALIPDMKGKGLYCSRGIHNELNHPDCVDAYNLMCSIRSAYARYRKPYEDNSVDYREPIDAGCCPHAECMIRDNEGSVEALVTMCLDQLRIFEDAAEIFMHVLSGDLYRAFSYYTDDSEMTRLACMASKYHPAHLNGYVLASAEELLTDIGKPFLDDEELIYSVMMRKRKSRKHSGSDQK